MIFYILADLIVQAVVGVTYERWRQNKAERSRSAATSPVLSASSTAQSGASPPGGPPATPSSSSD